MTIEERAKDEEERMKRANKVILEGIYLWFATFTLAVCRALGITKEEAQALGSGLHVALIQRVEQAVANYPFEDRKPRHNPEWKANRVPHFVVPHGFDYEAFHAALSGDVSSNPICRKHWDWTFLETMSRKHRLNTASTLPTPLEAAAIAYVTFVYAIRERLRAGWAHEISTRPEKLHENLIQLVNRAGANDPSIEPDRKPCLHPKTANLGRTGHGGMAAPKVCQNCGAVQLPDGEWKT